MGISFEVGEAQRGDPVPRSGAGMLKSAASRVRWRVPFGVEGRPGRGRGGHGGVRSETEPRTDPGESGEEDEGESDQQVLRSRIAVHGSLPE